MYYQLSNSHNHNFYYLKIQNGKYLKYLSNKLSRYDNTYFNNMNDAYRISKKHSNKPLISVNFKMSGEKSKCYSKPKISNTSNLFSKQINYKNQCHIPSVVGNPDIVDTSNFLDKNIRSNSKWVSKPQNPYSSGRTSNN